MCDLGFLSKKTEIFKVNYKLKINYYTVFKIEIK